MREKQKQIKNDISYLLYVINIGVLESLLFNYNKERTINYTYDKLLSCSRGRDDALMYILQINIFKCKNFELYVRNLYDDYKKAIFKETNIRYEIINDKK